MTKKFITAIFFFIISLNIFCQDLMKYKITKIKEIKTGKEEGELGFKISLLLAGGSPGARTFSLSYNRIFVPDLINKRINVYDLNLNFIKTIEEKGNSSCHFARKIYVDIDINLICLSSKGLKKIDYDGFRKFSLKREQLPNEINQYKNFHLINNQIFFRNDSKEIQMIDETGVVRGRGQALEAIQNIESKMENNLNQNTSHSSTYQLARGNQDALKALNQNNQNILIGDKFYSSSISEMKEYFVQVKKLIPEENRKQMTTMSGSSVNKKQEQKKIDIDLEKLIDPEVVGYDDYHNIYWQAGIRGKDKWTTEQVIIVFSRYGDVIDVFQYGQKFRGEPNFELAKSSNAKITIAPNGDVWLMRGDQKAYRFWKVERQW